MFLGFTFFFAYLFRYLSWKLKISDCLDSHYRNLSASTVGFFFCILFSLHWQNHILNKSNTIYCLSCRGAGMSNFLVRTCLSNWKRVKWSATRNSSGGPALLAEKFLSDIWNFGKIFFLHFKTIYILVTPESIFVTYLRLYCYDEYSFTYIYM